MLSRNDRRQLKKDNRKQSAILRPLPADQWPVSASECDRLKQVWRSRDFLVQLFNDDEGVYRLSVNRAAHDGRRWVDGITWDELMEVKRQAGFGGVVAVEIYPDDANVVDVSNMRHLWLLSEPPPFMWSSKNTEGKQRG